jgi:hypothetical protein
MEIGAARRRVAWLEDSDDAAAGLPKPAHDGDGSSLDPGGVRHAQHHRWLGDGHGTAAQHGVTAPVDVEHEARRRFGQTEPAEQRVIAATGAEGESQVAAEELDLGAVRDWDYYTGPTFEVFSVDSGFALGSGGRYDALLSRFGTALPATGFVLHVDRCHDSIVRRAGALPEATVLRVSWERDAHADALQLARDLRRRRVACACDLAAGGDGGIRVSSAGVRWSQDGHEERGSIDTAVTALGSGTP